MKKAKKKFIFEFDNLQMALFIAGLVTICLLSYAVGLKVGVKKGGQEMREAALNKDLRHKIKAPSLLNTEKKQGRVKEEKKHPASIETVIAESSKKKALPAKKAARVEAPPIAVAKIPAKVAGENTEAKKKAEKKGSYFVQVAAFKSAGDAETRAGELSKKGYKTVIVKAEIAGKGTYHRVRLGPFNSLKEARAFAASFEKKEKVSTFIPSN